MEQHGCNKANVQPGVCVLLLYVAMIYSVCPSCQVAMIAFWNPTFILWKKKKKQLTSVCLPQSHLSLLSENILQNLKGVFSRPANQLDLSPKKLALMLAVFSGPVPCYMPMSPSL